MKAIALRKSSPLYHHRAVSAFLTCLPSVSVFAFTNLVRPGTDLYRSTSVAHSSLIGCTSCIAKSLRSRRSCHFEPSLDALNLLSDVTSLIEIHSLCQLGGVCRPYGYRARACPPQHHITILWCCSHLTWLPLCAANQSEFKLPWREAGPPNHQDDEVGSDQ